MDEKLDYGVKLEAHPNFKWESGMKTMCGVRLKEGWLLNTWVKRDPEFAPIPDIEDAATKGCLLSIVRRITKDDEAHVAKFEQGWCICVWPEPNVVNYHSTEGIALASYISESARYL